MARAAKDDDEREAADHGSGPLARYRQKRSGDTTGEPMGGAVAPTAAGGSTLATPGARLFVVQKHAARRLHWDLRLEIDGVLRSWAVPRGPSLDPADRRLAVQTEDHPIEYVDFEGVIPEGNYGAGAMIVWDRGTFVELEPFAEGMRSGKLLFELRGHKLRGVWTLVKTKGGGDNEWLLIKKPDSGSKVAGMADPDERSILSGLTIEEVERGVDRAVAVRARLRELGVPHAPVEPKAAHMLAETKDAAFSDPAWVFELKYDGYRLFASCEEHVPRLRYRSGIDATAAFPEIARTIAALPYARFVLDGEVVVLDDDARPNFQRLQKRAMLLRARDVDRAMREHPVVLYAFDLLDFEGYDLRGLTLVERKQLLRAVLPSAGAVRFADHIPERGEALWQQVVALGLEGIVAKRAESTYVGGRSSAWIKIRTEHTGDFVIVGFTEPEGARTGFGALHLAAWGKAGLGYVGRVGTGFDEDTLAELRSLLEPIERDAPACVGPLPSGAKQRWVDPELVCEIRYKHLTDDGLLRHPVFLRLRDDKPASECSIPGEESPEPELGEAAPAPEPEPEPGPVVATDTRRNVVVSNPDKLFWPDDGFRKRDLIAFYRRVSPWLLPYLRDRPLVLTRYPDGIAGKSFFQKNAPPYVPQWLRTQTMWSEHAGREIEYFVVDDVEALTYVVNLAAIPLHVWGSRLADLQHPDWCILDLDPKGAPFAHVVRIARRIRELCEEIELPSYLKTSGSTGLHVLVPLGGQCTFDQCKQIGEVIGRVISSELRDIATIERAMRARRGRVYIDYVQNGHGRLLVAPLSVRPLPRAPVSTPLRWDELHEDMDQHELNMLTVPPRLEAMHSDPMLPVLSDRPDLPQLLGRLLNRLPG